MLSVSYYPVEFKNWSVAEYWIMGAVRACLLLCVFLINGAAYSVVAKRYGIPVPRITLFVFGGVSQIAEEPPSAGKEFWIAVVGPVASFALAAFFWELEPLVSFSSPLLALTEYLALINLVLGVFNLIPGFPLDGGRVLRAVAWRVTGKYQRATAVAAVTGRFFGFFLIFLGVWQALGGHLLNGLWIAFIGWVLYRPAGSQLQHEALRSLIGDHYVVEAMKRNFPYISGDVTLQELVDKQILTGGARYFRVGDARLPTG